MITWSRYNEEILLSKWLSSTQNWTAANKTIMTSIYLGCLVAHHYSTRNLLVIGFWKSPLQNVTYEFSDHLLKFLGDCMFFHSISFFFIFFLARNFRSCWSADFGVIDLPSFFVWRLMNPWGEVSATLMESQKIELLWAAAPGHLIFLKDRLLIRQAGT